MARVTSSTAPHAADPWDRYSRLRAESDRTLGVQGRLYWDWYQRTGPGAEILGDMTGRTIVDLGAGTGRQAACIARMHAPQRVAAIDSSPAQIQRGRDLFGHVPGLEFVQADAADYLAAAPERFDAVYSLFGALDFTDPSILLPTIADALRPGGILVIATLARYRGGQPPETDVRPAVIPVRRDDGTQDSMLRWVLDGGVWAELLTGAGFTDITNDTLSDPGPEGQPPMATNLLVARR
jgi:SAM-dependent methyltransferase